MSAEAIKSDARRRLAKARGPVPLLLTEPASKETKAFESAAAKIEMMIADLAAGGDQDDQLAVYRAIDRLDDRASKPEIRGRTDRDVFFERASYLRRSVSPAAEQGYQNRRAQREIEAKALRQAERAALPEPGSYLHELTLMRGGR